MKAARAAFIPYLLLLAVSFPLWYAGLRLRGGKGLLDHSPIDQQTRQAAAWLEGRLDLPQAPDYLEIARKDGRFYNSFPPTPSLVELPLVLLFGARTPSSLVGIYFFWYAALVAQYVVLRRRRFPVASAVFASLAFVFGTNLYATCVRANVWAYGQSLGYCLAVLGLVFVVENRGRGLRGPGPGYLLLSLAVGCRPLLALLLPLFVVLDHRTCGRSLKQAVPSAAAWMAPVALLLAAFNHARFGSPLEFGHHYLAWAEGLPEGLFSLAHLPWNAYHAFLRLPGWRSEPPGLFFDSAGTAFWLNNGILVIALWGLVARPMDRAVKATALFALATIGTGILLYEGEGNAQFGFRYVIDLLPVGFVAFALAYDRATPGMVAVAAASFLVNLYGLAVWKGLPKYRPGVSAPPAALTFSTAEGAENAQRAQRNEWV
jgi:hypothetical protein